MKDFQIKTLVDDNFELPIKGILNIKGHNAIIDPSYFESKPFFQPLKMLLKNDMDETKISDILNELGIKVIDIDDYIHNRKKFILDPCNHYDLSEIFVDLTTDIKRIQLEYIYSPINSLYLMDIGDYIDVIISPFNKTYYSISDHEWYSFLLITEKAFNIQLLRAHTLDILLNDRIDSTNIIRHLRFIMENSINNKAIRFLESVMGYYNTKGIISEKQLKKVSELIY